MAETNIINTKGFRMSFDVQISDKLIQAYREKGYELRLTRVVEAESCAESGTEDENQLIFMLSLTGDGFTAGGCLYFSVDYVHGLLLCKYSLSELEPFLYCRLAELDDCGGCVDLMAGKGILVLTEDLAEHMLELAIWDKKPVSEDADMYADLAAKAMEVQIELEQNVYPELVGRVHWTDD
jgi:hypothetical protein